MQTFQNVTTLAYIRQRTKQQDQDRQQKASYTAHFHLDELPPWYVHATIVGALYQILYISIIAPPLDSESSISNARYMPVFYAMHSNSFPSRVEYSDSLVDEAVSYSGMWSIDYG
jgi:hypothetical protein